VSLVLHSVDRTAGVGILGQAARILAPGGKVLVTDFGTGELRFPRG
jgi:ubiquinone/menaquinone biosynthesis C-methylase UbiE